MGINKFESAKWCSLEGDGGCTGACVEAVDMNTALHSDGSIEEQVAAVENAFNGSHCKHPQARSARGRADKFIKENKKA